MKSEDMQELLDLIKPVKDYQDEFAKACVEPLTRISTGILGLDQALNGGLSNELHILGAETSTGKSAGMMYVAQNVAAAGIDVLYFALEMSRRELIARGVAAISCEHNLEDPKAKVVTASDILGWRYESAISDFARMQYDIYENYVGEYFARYGEHLHIIEGGISGLSAVNIANMATWYKRKTGNQVVVFVDYLQLLIADADDRTQADRKTKTDRSVVTLKALASQVGIPVVVISSLGRGSYSGDVSSSSYKESGDIEYTGGILLGWNWQGVTNRSDKEARADEIAACKARGYRYIKLEVLKSRNGERDKAVWLKYYPAHNYFVETTKPKPAVKQVEAKKGKTTY